MYCKYCGIEHTATQRYCTVCGKDFLEKKKKPIATIILSCSTGFLAVATIVLCFLLPRQYKAGYSVGFNEGEVTGYEAGYNEGIEKFDEGYALGWEQKQTVIDADIAQTSEYKSWARAYPELGKTDVDDELKAIYNELHADIDNWYNTWQEDAIDRIGDLGSNNGINFNDYSKYRFLECVLDYSVDVLHNVIDNMLLFENDHLNAKSIFPSAYYELENVLKDKGIFE